MPQKLTLVFVGAGWFSLFSSCPGASHRPPLEGHVGAAKLVGRRIPPVAFGWREGVMASEGMTNKVKGPLV